MVYVLDRRLPPLLRKTAFARNNVFYQFKRVAYRRYVCRIYQLINNETLNSGIVDNYYFNKWLTSTYERIVRVVIEC